MEIIEHETAELSDIPNSEYELLAEGYLSRGESYLICERFKEAVSDLQKGYELAAFCKDDEKRALALRSLFGLALAYGYLDMLEEVYASARSMRAILDSCNCADCNEFLKVGLHELNHSTLVNQPILGPTQISVSECVDRVNGVQNASKVLIVKAKPEIQIVLHIMIDDLADRARFCCRRGGVWKGCLQPVVNKWHLWNEKWKLFAIPPDPSWD